jgi:predicted ATPase with chaperone activity
METMVDSELAHPVAPVTIEDSGINVSFLEDLVLKTVSADSNCTSERVAERIKLPLTITEFVMQSLYRQRFIEIRESMGTKLYRYAMLEKGWDRAMHLISINSYIGPAPVTLDEYAAWIRRMNRSARKIDPESVKRAFSHLVLSDRELETLGLVVESRRSLFLTGPPGSGKTSAAKALHATLQGEIWIPYAVEVDNQIIRIFDTHVHHLVAPPEARHDRRWIKIKRPLVIVGGEMTLESMDLIFAGNVNFYEAPFQLKANGGVLIIDDFGRQRVEPQELLNRWIVPLENHIDYLTLHTGKKIEVPFEQLLVFATNLETRQLVDEAFLRRMGYRLAFMTPGEKTYVAILNRYLESSRLAHDPELPAFLLNRYKRENRMMKACEPRDLVERCLDICRYENLPMEITIDIMDRAWYNYFGSPN